LKNIGLNIILGLFFSGVTILYLHERITSKLELEEEQYKEKIKNIKPEIPKIKSRMDKDIIDLVFSIQDFYIYNPEAFEEMADNINNFLTIHDFIFNNEPFCELYYEIAESKKNNAINALHSIIFNLPNDNDAIDKLNRAHKRLDTILTKHLNEIYDKCHYKLTLKGYDVFTKKLDLGPKPANHYFDKKFTYQFY
jgi:hypothetical protein